MTSSNGDIYSSSRNQKCLAVPQLRWTEYKQVCTQDCSHLGQTRVSINTTWLLLLAEQHMHTTWRCTYGSDHFPPHIPHLRTTGIGIFRRYVCLWKYNSQRTKSMYYDTISDHLRVYSLWCFLVFMKQLKYLSWPKLLAELMDSETNSQKRKLCLANFYDFF